MMLRAVSLALFTVLLTACSSSEEKPEPIKLEKVASDYEVDKLWSASVGGGDPLEHLVVSSDLNTVFVASASGDVTALNAENGDKQWSVDLDVNLLAGPAAGGSLVVVSADDGLIIALDQASGEEVWRRQLANLSFSLPAFGSKFVMIHTIDGKIAALDLIDGEEVWVVERDVPALTLQGGGDMTMAGNQLMVGLPSGKLLGLNAENGQIFWEFPISMPRGRSELDRIVDIETTPVIGNGRIYAASYAGRIVAVSPQGKLVWDRDFDTPVHQAADSRRLYVTNSEGVVLALNQKNGAAIWKMEQLQYRELSNSIVMGDVFVVGDDSSELHFIDGYDGEFIARASVSGNAVRHLSLHGETIFSLSYNGKLTALRLNKKLD